MSRKKINPFKSTLEHKIATRVLTEYLYEPKGSGIEYTVPHVYNPDFIHPQQPDIIIEVKGYFIKGHSDCQKYIAVARDNPDKELVFIFSDPDKKAYGQCRERKDGTFMTLAEWSRKNNFLYFHADKVPRDLCKGRWNIDQVREYKNKFYGRS